MDLSVLFACDKGAACRLSPVTTVDRAGDGRMEMKHGEAGRGHLVNARSGPYLARTKYKVARNDRKVSMLNCFKVRYRPKVPKQDNNGPK